MTAVTSAPATVSVKPADVILTDPVGPDHPYAHRHGEVLSSPDANRRERTGSSGVAGLEFLPELMTPVSYPKRSPPKVAMTVTTRSRRETAGGGVVAMTFLGGGDGNFSWKWGS